MTARKSAPAKTTKVTTRKAPVAVRALSAREKRFCEEYVVDCNGTQAAIRAGYSAKTANEQAARLLAKVSIKQHLSTLQAQLSKKTGITAERVVNEVGAILFNDPRKLFDAAGHLKAIVDLDDATAAAIASVEVDTLFDGQGKERKSIGITTKVKFWDKNSAAEKLMKHLGLFEKDNKQKTDPVSELIALINGTSLPVVKDNA